MENAVIALQVAGLGPITAISSFVQNQPRSAARAYTLDLVHLWSPLSSIFVPLSVPTRYDAVVLASQRTNRIQLSSTLIRQ